MKKIIIAISALAILVSGSFVYASGGYVLDIFRTISGVTSPSIVTNDFAIPGSTGLTGTSTATLFADVSEELVYMKNANIGSITLENEIISPFDLSYAVGSATSSTFTVGSSGNLNISASSSTYPNQFVLGYGGNVGI